MLNSDKCCSNRIRNQYPDPRLMAWQDDTREISVPAAVDSQLKIFLFMCRFTCSRCWKSALALAEFKHKLKRDNVQVGLVGNGKYLEQATRLAAEFQLPFTVIADEKGTLRRKYNFPVDHYCHGQAIILVDEKGIVRYSQRTNSPTRSLKLSSLMMVIQGIRSGALV